MKRIYAGLLAILLLISVAKAQQTEQNDTIKHYQLDDIEIKSPKYNQNIFEIPAAATMVSERLIESNKVQNLTDISAIVPNFFMPDYGSKLTSPVYIRGVGNRINTPSVGLYVDGIPYFEKAAFNFDFFDVERIEVLRGPQGTLYGRNAMGGLINILTNQPHNKRSTKISLDYGNYNQINTQISHNQPISKTFAVLGNFSQRHNDGFFTNEFNGNKVDNLNSYSGRLKLLFTPSDKFKASGNIQYEDSKQGGYPYAVFNDESNEANDINYDHKSTYDRNLFSSGLNLEYNVGSYIIRSVSSFQSVNDVQAVDQDFTPADKYFVTQDQDLNMFAQEINIQSQENAIYDWLFGVFGFKQLLDKEVHLEMGEDQLANMPFSEYSYTKAYDNSNSGIAFFHQSTLKFGDLSLSAGIRADYEKATLDYNYDKSVNGNVSNADQFESEMDFFEVLPKIAVKYSISKYIVPYATIAKGYNSGGFNSTFEREEDRSFKPEQSWNYEAGIKAKWLEQRVYANLAFFYIDWTNQQIYQTVPSGTGSMLTNAGKSESKGVEFEIKALPAKHLETWLALGYNDAKFVEYVKNENEDYSGNYLPYVPRFSFNIGGNYSVDINKDWLEKIRFHITYNGFGKHYWKETNEAYQAYYGLLNSRISFEHKNITLAFWGKNILNSEYNSFYFQALGNSYAQLGKPATIGVNLKVSF
uniref:TonB-dependent receptor n=1 Tax=uncultured Draconibacterium sp. TaxID=1573823 RepID=UPI003217D6A1